LQDSEILNSENLKNLNILKPPSEKDLSPEGEASYYKRLSQQVKWVPNAAQTGVVLVFPDAASGLWKPVADKQRKPI
jgi:hypothetical protein